MSEFRLYSAAGHLIADVEVPREPDAEPPKVVFWRRRVFVWYPFLEQYREATHHKVAESVAAA